MVVRRQPKKSTSTKVTKKKSTTKSTKEPPTPVISKIEKMTEELHNLKPSSAVPTGPTKFQGVIPIETGGREHDALVLTDDIIQLLKDMMRMTNGLKWIRDTRQRNENGKKLVTAWWNDLPDEMKDVHGNTSVPWLDKIDRDLSDQYVHLMRKSSKIEEDIVAPREKLFKSLEDVLVEHGVLFRKEILDP